MLVDKQMLQRHLSEAETHVSRGIDLVARQRELAAELERDGHTKAAADARSLLATLERTQEMHIADRDRIAGELAKLQPG